MINNINAFVQRMLTDLGSSPPLEEITTGRFIRFATSVRSGDKAGWCRIFDGGDIGIYGCWRQGISRVWHAQTPQTSEERRAVTEREKMAWEKVRQDLEQVRAQCRRECTELLEIAREADPKHPYLVGKDVNSYGLQQNMGRLIVPLRDSKGTVHGVQFLRSPEQRKYFQTGTLVTGCYHLIGKPNGTIILICEGYATGATLYEITSYAVAVAFTAGNLKAVAQAFREMYPDAIIILCADDDHNTEGNPGMTKATEAALAVGGKLAVPLFHATREPKDTDFNDLRRLDGPVRVKECIDGARSMETNTEAIM